MQTKRVPTNKDISPYIWYFPLVRSTYKFGGKNYHVSVFFLLLNILHLYQLVSNSIRSMFYLLTVKKYQIVDKNTTSLVKLEICSVWCFFTFTLGWKIWRERYCLTVFYNKQCAKCVRICLYRFCLFRFHCRHLYLQFLKIN